MPEQNNEQKTKEMTIQQAAKAVHRKIPKLKDGERVLDKNGEPVLAEEAVPVEDVMSFKDYGTHVVVITTAGEKLTSA